jgi:hypothetical protein
VFSTIALPLHRTAINRLPLTNALTDEPRYKKSSRTEYNSPCASRSFALINPPAFEHYSKISCNFTTLKGPAHPLFATSVVIFIGDLGKTTPSPLLKLNIFSSFIS